MSVIKNTLYMLKHMFKASPMGVICSLIYFFIWRGMGLIYTVVLMRYLMQSIETGGDFRNVVILLLVILVITLFTEIFCAWFDNSYFHRMQVVFQEYFMTLIYKQAISCDLACYENPTFYDKYTRANTELISRLPYIIENIASTISTIISSIICIVITARWEPVIIPIVIACAVISAMLEKKRANLRFECVKETTPFQRQNEYVKRTVYLQDYAKEMRLGNIFFPLLDHFNEAVRDWVDITKKYYRKVSVLRCVRGLVMSLGTFISARGIIVYRYLVNHAYSMTDMITVMNAASQMQSYISSFSWHLPDLMDNSVYIQNLREFLEYEPKIVENESGRVPEAGSNHLTLKNVSFTYDGSDKPVLKNISIDLKPKTKIALVGHNGAGKSTLVKLIMRLYDVTDGEILLDNVNIKEYKLSEYRRKFGTIFQDFKIFATTVTENVLLHPPIDDTDRKKAETAIQASGLWDKIQTLPNTMETHLTKEFDDNGALMSGGEFQKIAVARVFAKESSIAILDEPSSALDPISEYEMFNNMMTACADKTVIFISHRLSSAVMADKIYMLENGEIIEEGSHEELMKLGGKYAEMFMMQAEKYREQEVQE
ncbi:MAG: ABC transporter ATP-binding protein [Oscillospiraceae bacterium]|nr:ABC transporter ATP-binding protein [Oscillospiraceae bacterium]